ncbi:MAG: hypothetical protein ACM3UZ_07750 [Acidobacteriota bacterium]
MKAEANNGSGSSTLPQVNTDIKPIEYVTLYHPSGRYRRITREQYEKMRAASVRPARSQGMARFSGMGGGFGIINKLFSGLQNILSRLGQSLRKSLNAPPKE